MKGLIVEKCRKATVAVLVAAAVGLVGSSQVGAVDFGKGSVIAFICVAVALVLQGLSAE